MAWAWKVEWNPRIGGSPVSIRGQGKSGMRYFRLKSEAKDFVKELELSGINSSIIRWNRVKVDASLVPKKEEEE